MHQPVGTQENDKSSMIIFAWVILTVVISGIRIFTNNIDFTGGFVSKFLYVVIPILQFILLILPPFAIKDKKLRIAGIVIMAVYVIWLLIDWIQFLNKYIWV